MQDSRLHAALAHKKAPAPASAATPRESCALGVKSGFSLFPADRERIAAIRATLASRGHRITASGAVRLALRAVELNPERLAQLLETMKAEDGRTRRHEKAESGKESAETGQDPS